MRNDRNSELKKRGKTLIKIAVALAVYCVLAVIFSIPCPIKAITGISCPGCGMTRSLLSLFRFDFSAALYYHPLIFLIVLIIPFLTYLHLYQYDKLCKVIMTCSALILLVFYLYRMIIAHSPILEFSPQNGIFPRLYRWIFNLFC